MKESMVVITTSLSNYIKACIFNIAIRNVTQVPSRKHWSVTVMPKYISTVIPTENGEMEKIAFCLGYKPPHASTSCLLYVQHLGNTLVTSVHYSYIMCH